MSVSFEYYKIFYYVGKYQSFNKAAKALMNSQSNITRSINNLEAELGCELFIRSHKGVTLTAAGRQLYGHVESACKHFQMGEAELDTLKNRRKGHISIGFSTGISERMLQNSFLPILHDYHIQYPEVCFRLLNESSPKLISYVLDGLVDFAVITSCPSYEDGSRGRILRSFQDILIAGPAFSSLKEYPVHLADIARYPFISTCRGTETYRFYHEFFISQGLSFVPGTEASTADQVLYFVENNMGLGFVSQTYAEKALTQKKVFQVPLLEKIPRRSISIFHSNDTVFNAAATQLEEMICTGLMIS